MMSGRPTGGAATAETGTGTKAETETETGTETGTGTGIATDTATGTGRGTQTETSADAHMAAEMLSHGAMANVHAALGAAAVTRQGTWPAATVRIGQLHDIPAAGTRITLSGTGTVATAGSASPHHIDGRLQGRHRSESRQKSTGTSSSMGMTR